MEEYISEAQQIATIADVMAGSTVSWKYYNNELDANLSSAIADGSAYAYWSPLQSKNSSYLPAYSSHFVNRTEFFTDVSTGALPAVSWVIPSLSLSEHNPANITLGSYWVQMLINSIMLSKYWADTAIILCWDDYGGYYDNVLPPLAPGGERLGFRVPAIIISPYSRPGYIDNTAYSFESILRFIEYDFGLHCLTPRDCQANNLLNSFQFTRPGTPVPAATTIPQSARQEVLLLANSTVEED